MQTPQEQCIPGPAPHDPPGDLPRRGAGDGTTFAQLLAEIRAQPINPATYAALVAVFRTFDGVRVRISAREIEVQARESLAAQMLAAGHKRPEVRSRLMRDFGIGRTTAYRDLSAALARRAPPMWPGQSPSAARRAGTIGATSLTE